MGIQSNKSSNTNRATNRLNRIRQIIANLLGNFNLALRRLKLQSFRPLFITKYSFKVVGI